MTSAAILAVGFLNSFFFTIPDATLGDTVGDLQPGIPTSLHSILSVSDRRHENQSVEEILYTAPPSTPGIAE